MYLKGTNFLQGQELCTEGEVEFSESKREKI